MSISVNCDECGKTLKAPDSAAGQKAKCPQCGATVKIPEKIYEAEEAAEADEDENPFDGIKSTGSRTESEDDNRKPCPVCGEMIMANAAKCRYCNEIFDPKLKKKSKKSSKGGSADDDMSTGDWVVAILFSGIGCIAGIVWMIQGKSKGPKMFGVSLLAGLFWGVIRVILESVNRQNRF
jgi:predicted RNA-binding Zn-ribbon protein involved in translation (DUF1610 family)